MKFLGYIVQNKRIPVKENTEGIHGNSLPRQLQGEGG
jgi:hypothetical protein